LKYLSNQTLNWFKTCWKVKWKPPLLWAVRWYQIEYPVY